MNKLLVAAVVLAPVARLPVAHAGSHAGTCEGGSSGGNSSGTGSGDASHYTNSNSNYYFGSVSRVTIAGSAPEACEDASDVIGYRRCTKFGAWGKDLRIPRIAVEGGVIVRRFGSLLDHQTGSVTHGGESFAYRVLGQTRARPLDTAVLSTLRASVGLPHGIYTALEVDLGGLTQPGQAATEMMSTGTFGSPSLQQERGLVVDSLGTVGVHGATHGGGLGVELSGGVRAVSYSFQSNYRACEQATSITAFAPIVEARARGELWLSPWLTAGVTLGTSVIEKHAWMGGVYFAVHTRAFGGER